MPFDRCRYPLSQGDGARFGKQRLQKRRVSLGVSDISSAGGKVPSLKGYAKGLLKECDHIEEGSARSEGEIDGRCARDLMFEGRAEDIDDAANKSEVAGLVSVPMDRQRGIPKGSGDEGRQNGGIGMPGSLVGSVHVEEAECKDGQIEASGMR